MEVVTDLHVYLNIPVWVRLDVAATLVLLHFAASYWMWATLFPPAFVVPVQEPLLFFLSSPLIFLCSLVQVGFLHSVSWTFPPASVIHGVFLTGLYFSPPDPDSKASEWRAVAPSPSMSAVQSLRLAMVRHAYGLVAGARAARRCDLCAAVLCPGGRRVYVGGRVRACCACLHQARLMHPRPRPLPRPARPDRTTVQCWDDCCRELRRLERRDPEAAYRRGLDVGARAGRLSFRAWLSRVGRADEAVRYDPSRRCPQYCVPSGDNALTRAARDGDLGRLRELLESEGSELLIDRAHGPMSCDLFRRGATRPPSHTPLIAAAICGRPRCLSLILDYGASIDHVLVNDFGDEYECSTALGHAAKEGHLDCVEELLRRGADPDAGVVMSPLHCAATRKHPRCLAALIRGGAKVDALAPHWHQTPLILAAWEPDNAECLELLLDAGADAGARHYPFDDQERGENAAEIAFRRDEGLSYRAFVRHALRRLHGELESGQFPKIRTRLRLLRYEEDLIASAWHPDGLAFASYCQDSDDEDYSEYT